MVVSNDLCRREGNLIYIPIDPSTDNGGNTVAGLVHALTASPESRGEI